MKVMFREKLQLDKRISCTDSGKLGCKKWNKGITSIFGLIALLTLIGIVLYNVLGHCTSCGHCDKKTDHAKRLLITKEESHCKSKTNDLCHLQCSSLHADALNEHIAVSINETNCGNINLDLEDITFDNDELSQGWLNVTPKIRELEIKNCAIKEINEAAFSGHPFTKLKRLWIVNIKIEALKRHSFLDLPSLTDFAVRSDKFSTNLMIEEKALEGMSSTLTILELSGFILTPNDVSNLTGTKAARLPKIVTISLDYNTINELPENSFQNAGNTVALYLHGCGLQNMHKKSLWGLTRIQRLQLNTNDLKTLPEGVFDGLNNLIAGRVFLGDNPWDCTCQLEWLQTYYISTNYVDRKNPPTCHDGIQFEIKNFCENITTDSSTTESVTTSNVTTEAPHLKEITIKCKNLTTSPASATINETLNSTIIDDVLVNVRESEPVNLSISQIDQDPFLVVIEASGNLDDYHLLWFSENDKSKMECVTPVKPYMVFENLKRDTTYIFSLLHYEEETVSPKNCFSLRTEPEWQERTWLTNKNQALIISVNIGMIVFLICFSIFCTFMCIRKFPKLIKGNKNVIIVKPRRHSKKNDVESNEYERPPYIPPSSQGYLTPKYHKYAKVRYRPPLIRSISEWTTTTNNSNYTEPTQQQLQAWRLLYMRRQNEKNSYQIRDEYKPPLPPPNPVKQNGEKTTKEVSDEGVVNPV